MDSWIYQDGDRCLFYVPIFCPIQNGEATGNVLDVLWSPKTQMQGQEYTQVSAGTSHTVLLRSDGQAVACGLGLDGRTTIPAAKKGCSYTQVSAGDEHTVLLCSDGTAVAYGENSGRHSPKEGISYTQVSAGRNCTMLLRSDGTAETCHYRWNRDPRSNIPPLDEGVVYTQVSAGHCHAVLLRSDGTAVACGQNFAGQCDIPPLEEGRSYTQVSAGGEHTVLLRDDGRAVACGSNGYGQCDIPVLEETVSYIQVSAGLGGTVLIRSDGSAVACGTNGERKIPSLPKTTSWLEWFRGFFAAPSSTSSLRYVGSNNVEPVTKGGHRILQLDCVDEDVSMLKLSSLAGEEVLRLRAHRSDSAAAIHQRIAQELKTEIQSLPVVLPDGQLLASMYRANSLATVADVMEQGKRI